MKRCPACQKTYTDDLRYCLQDGTELEIVPAEDSSDQYKTWVLPESSAAVVPPPAEARGQMQGQATRAAEPSPQTVAQIPRHTNPATEQPFTTATPTGRSTATVVALTVVATIALLGLGGLTAWLLLGDKKSETTRDDKTAETNTARTTSDNGTSSTDATANINNRNAASPTPTSSPATQTVTPAPIPAGNPAAEEAAVRSALNGWLASFRAGDLDGYMAHYAGLLESYYLSRNVSRERVRADKARAFAKYSTMNVWLSNIRVQVDPSGQRATATFEKSYSFSGPGVNTFEGSGPNRFTFSKIAGEWLIVGEEDLSR